MYSLDGPLIELFHHRAGVADAKHLALASFVFFFLLPLVVLLERSSVKHASSVELKGSTTESTCAPVKVLVVDDDAVAHAGEVQAVSEAVGAAALGVHHRLAAGRQGRL